MLFGGGSWTDHCALGNPGLQLPLPQRHCPRSAVLHADHPFRELNPLVKPARVNCALANHPQFVCETAYDQCVRETDSSREQDECKTNIKDNCGKIDPVDAKPNSEPAETTTSDGPAPTDTGSDSQNEANTSTSTAGAAPTNFAYLGNGAAVVAAGVFAALL